jgi:hypothetical protein
MSDMRKALAARRASTTREDSFVAPAKETKRYEPLDCQSYFHSVTTMHVNGTISFLEQPKSLVFSECT